MIEDTVDILKVVAMRIAMAAPGPNPGNTPTSVPNRTPMKQMRRLEGIKIMENP